MEWPRPRDPPKCLVRRVNVLLCYPAVALFSCLLCSYLPCCLIFLFSHFSCVTLVKLLHLSVSQFSHLWIGLKFKLDLKWGWQCYLLERIIMKTKWADINLRTIPGMWTMISSSYCHCYHYFLVVSSFIHQAFSESQYCLSLISVYPSLLTSCFKHLNPIIFWEPPPPRSLPWFLQVSRTSLPSPRSLQPISGISVRNPSLPWICPVSRVSSCPSQSGIILHAINMPLFLRNNPVLN